MSTAAARGDDAIAFYAADIGETRLLSATVAPIQNSDADGPFEQGRYLIQAHNASTTGVIVWVTVGAFVKGSPLVFTTGPGLRRVPLSLSGLIAIETNVLKGDSDRIGVVTSAGTADVYITRISRGA